MESTKLNCSMCDISFDASEEQRRHAKSESHVQNLRRRAAASGLITLPAPDNFRVPDSSDDSELPKDEASQSGTDTGDDVTEDEVPEFDPQNCIFCSYTGTSFDENLNHMKTAHSLNIPYQDYLVVTSDTLVWYLHLVIFGYHECIFCGTRRRTVEGVQQHMLDKGHCRVDMSDDMMEFYDIDGVKGYGADNAVRPDEESLRLPSGKILSHRTASSTKPRHRTTPPEQDQTALPSHASSDALTTRDRKDVALATQLARLSVKDQQSLIHLPDSQQRSFLLQRKKEIDTARRAERRMQIKTERLSNRTMMKHFANDVPGRSNG